MEGDIKNIEIPCQQLQIVYVPKQGGDLVAVTTDGMNLVYYIPPCKLHKSSIYYYQSTEQGVNANVTYRSDCINPFAACVIQRDGDQVCQYINLAAEQMNYYQNQMKSAGNMLVTMINIVTDDIGEMVKPICNTGLATNGTAKNALELHHCFPGFFAPNQDFMTIVHSAQITIVCKNRFFGVNYTAANGINSAWLDDATQTSNFLSRLYLKTDPLAQLVPDQIWSYFIQKQQVSASHNIPVTIEGDISLYQTLTMIDTHANCQHAKSFGDVRSASMNGTIMIDNKNIIQCQNTNQARQQCKMLGNRYGGISLCLGMQKPGGYNFVVVSSGMAAECQLNIGVQTLKKKY